jgi:hypothetical protein
MKKDSKQFEPLQVLPVPVPKSYKHPDAPSYVLPNHEYVMALVSPKGGKFLALTYLAGKTTLICNLFKFYTGYFHQIYVFSPTILSDVSFVLTIGKMGL